MSEERTPSNTKSDSRDALETTQSERPEWDLLDFDGSGMYVDVEARIDEIQYIKKETNNMPDVKGVLGEAGSSRTLPFVVQDGVSHPYFKQGNRFVFQNVKDHYYEEGGEVQVSITEHSRINEL